jgi:hypothetical protein
LIKNLRSNKGNPRRKIVHFSLRGYSEYCTRSGGIASYAAKLPDITLEKAILGYALYKNKCGVAIGYIHLMNTRSPNGKII